MEPVTQRSPSDEFDLWHKRIKLGLADREYHKKNWQKMAKDVAGVNFRDDYGKSLRPVAPVNQSNNVVRVMLPRLLPRDHLIIAEVSPKRPSVEGQDYATSAKDLGDRIASVLAETRAADQVRKAIKSGFYSAGVLKLVFQVRTGVVAEVKSEKSPGKTDVVDIDRERSGPSEYLDAELPTIKHVPATRLVVDPGATCLEDARWVAEVSYRRLEALKNDPSIQQYCKEHDVELDQLKGTHDAVPRGLTVNKTKTDEDAQRADPDLSLVEVWEVHDRDRLRVMTIPGSTSNIPKVIEERPWLPIEGFPYAVFQFDDIEDYFWPNPLLAPTFDGGTAVDIMLQQMTESVGNTKKVIAYDPDDVRDAEMVALASAKDGSIVPIKGLQRFVQEFEFGGFHPDLLRGIETIKGIKDEMDGIGETRRGVTGGSGITATAINKSQQQGDDRIADLKAEVDKGLRRMVEIMAAVLIQFKEMFADISLPIGNPEDAKFIAIGGAEEMVGAYLDYAYEIKITDRERIDPAIKLKRSESSIEVLTNEPIVMKLQAEGLDLKLGPVMKMYLEQLGHRDVDKILVRTNQAAAPEAQAQAAMQEDQQMIQTGQVLPVNPNDDHQAHLEVHQADAQQSGNEAIAEHASMHEMMLQSPGAVATGPTGPMAAGAPTPTPPPAAAGGPPQQQRNETGNAGSRQQVGQLNREAAA